MTYCNESKTPGSAFEWFDLGVSLRRRASFGDAINAFTAAADEASDEMEKLRESGSQDEDRIMALESLRSKALASVDLLKEINGFVNTDLMNP